MAGGHDQLFKDLISTFPHDLLRLMAPAIVARLGGGSFEPQPTEAFLDLPRGAARRPDVVLRAKACDGELVLLHFEVELRYRSTVPTRLWSYNRLLHLRSGCPVHTFLLCLRGGSPGSSRGIYREVSLGQEICRFRFRSLGLSGASAERYLSRGNPLAAALAALMRWPRGLSQAARYLACLERITRARGLSEAQRFLLVNCVATYLQLGDGAEREVEALLVEERNQEAKTLMMTWAETMRLEGMKDLLFRLLEARFRVLPSSVRTRVDAMRSENELTNLAQRISAARSLEELGLC